MNLEKKQFSISLRLRIFLLAALTALAFVNSTQNDFIGDDKVLFVKNRFYQTLAHFPKVFTRELVMSPESFGASHDGVMVSGCISYRPVTAATFFSDYALWKGNTAGHHLTNILLHFGVVVLAMFVFLRLTGQAAIAFMAAALFAVHPVQSELINTISYRSDILMTFFYLAGILAYWRYSLAVKKNSWLILSALAYFFALFSKESALTFPVMIILIDRFFIASPGRRAFTQILADKKAIYTVFIAISLFYLYVYFILMPNPVYLREAIVAQSVLDKGIVMLKIFAIYVRALFFPFQVSILPPLYAPPALPYLTGDIVLALGAIWGSIFLAWLSYRRDKIVALSVLWFFLAYIPVSGVVLLLNPLAYRFLYLPSLGFFLACAVGLHFMCDRIAQKIPTSNIGFFLKFAIIGLCVAMTISTNSFFKNDFSACKEMIRRYPDSSRPYWNLGLEYYRAGRYQDAISALLQHLKVPVNNPFISDDKEKFMTYHLLGIAHQDPDAAIGYLNQARAMFPEFVGLNLDLAKNYLLKKDYSAALNLAEDAVERDPGLVQGYVYIIHINAETGNVAQARVVLKEALKKFGETPQLEAVEAHLKQKEQKQ